MVWFPAGEMSVSSIASRCSISVWCLLGALSLGIKRPRVEADHSLPSSVEVKNKWSYTLVSPTCLHGLDGDKVFCNLVLVSPDMQNVLFP
jgi:hypothetical protein